MKKIKKWVEQEEKYSEIRIRWVRIARGVHILVMQGSDGELRNLLDN